MPDIQVIENRGPNTLQQSLLRELRSAQTLSAAVAFVNLKGIRKILLHLRKLAGRGGVRLVTGFYGYVTEPQALRELLKIQKETDGRLSVRIARDGGYHRKLFLIGRRVTGRAYVGSSNLTSKGLRESGELTLSLPLSLSSKIGHSLHEIFDADYDDSKSIPLSRDIIDRYARERKKHFRPTPKPTGASLGKIISRNPDDEPKGARGPRHFWRNYFDGLLKSENAELVSEQTDWERKGWLFYADSAPDTYRRGDRVLVIDLKDKRAILIEIKDLTEIPTSDGRYHRAFLHLRGQRGKKLTQRLKHQLAEAGALPSKASLRRRAALDEDTWAKVIQFFKMPKRRG